MRVLERVKDATLPCRRRLVENEQPNRQPYRRLLGLFPASEAARRSGIPTTCLTGFGTFNLGNPETNPKLWSWHDDRRLVTIVASSLQFSMEICKFTLFLRSSAI